MRVTGDVIIKGDKIKKHRLGVSEFCSTGKTEEWEEPGRHPGLEVHEQEGHVGQKLKEQDWAERSSRETQAEGRTTHQEGIE